MSYKFLPSSFGRRGTALPFERKILRYARLRIDDHEDKGKWHILLPNHGTARRGAVAVIPWQQLNQFTDMGARDEALRLTVNKVRLPAGQEDPAIDPMFMRKIALEVDRTQEELPDRKERAEQELKMDGAIRANVRLELFANMVQDFATHIEDEVLTNMTGSLYRRLSMVARHDEGMRSMIDRFAKKIVTYAAERLNTKPESMLRRMDDLADLMVPLSTADAEDVGQARATALTGNDERIEEGFLLRCRNAMWWLHTEIDAYRSRAREEMQYPIEMILFSLDQFLSAVTTPLGTIQRDTQHVGVALARYETVRPRLAEARQNIAWAVDGWPRMVELWREAIRRISSRESTPDGKFSLDDVMDMERALTAIFQHMPTMPNSEVSNIKTKLDAWNHFETARARCVQSGCDWSSSRPDEDLLSRIRKVKP